MALSTVRDRTIAGERTSCRQSLFDVADRIGRRDMSCCWGCDLRHRRVGDARSYVPPLAVDFAHVGISLQSLSKKGGKV